VYFQVRGAHRGKIRTTNPLERAFREVRRRTNPMSCFNNRVSVERILFAVLHHQNAKWSRESLPESKHKT